MSRAFRLLVVAGPARDLEVPIEGQRLTIGRDAACDITIDDVSVSRQHAEITSVGGGHLVRDLGSSNGTLVNDRPVHPVEGQRLRPGDRVRVGDSEMLFLEPKRAAGPASEMTARATTALMIGSSPALAAVRDLIARVAPTDATVLVTGESGTGKELAARAIHAAGRYPDEPLVIVDGPSLTESGLFGKAGDAASDGALARCGRGTLFLDEIGELPLELQAKLLRVLEDGTYRRVDGVEEQRCAARIVAASNRNLADEVKNGRFREDLYYRLDVVHIELPPLRERMDDLAELATYFVSVIAPTMSKKIRGVSDAALAKLRAHRWPGNVRELRNAVRRAVVVAEGSQLAPDDFGELAPPGEGRAVPDVASHSGTLRLEENERVLLERALEQTGGNKSRAAQLLGIGRNTLYEKMKRFGLS